MKVSKQTAGKIGLFTSISIMIGSIVGIGIFFKNGSVFKTNSGSGWGVLVSWILASVIAFATAFAFGEIGFGKNPQAGLAGSAEVFFGKRTKKFFSFSLGAFYYGILTLAIALFTGEAIVNVFNEAMVDKQINQTFPVWGVFVIGLTLLFLFIGFNLLAEKASHWFQNATTVLKFIPLIFVAIIGIIGACQGLGTNGFKEPIPIGDHIESQVTPTAIGILGSLPSILFAFDSFLCIGNLKNELRNPDRNVSLTVILGMSICTIFYLFITVSEVLIGQGTANGVINTFFANHQQVAQILGIVINVFILIAVAGVLNALTLTGIRAHEYLIQSQTIVGAYTILKACKYNTRKAGLIMSSLIFVFWWTVLLIPSAITNTDSYIDLVSNFPTLFFFSIYGSIVLMGFINRFTKKVEVKKVKGFLFFAPISIIGCYLVFGYQFFYGMLVHPIMYPDDLVSYGVFLSSGPTRHPVYNWQTSIVFFSMVVWFILSGLINEWILHKKQSQTQIALDCLNLIKNRHNQDIGSQNDENFNKINTIDNHDNYESFLDETADQIMKYDSFNK